MKTRIVAMAEEGSQGASSKARGIRQRLIRKRIKRKQQLEWWLIHGPARSGTSYMLRTIRTCSALYVTDWGLEHILNPMPGFGYIRFDYERFLRDVSDNIIDNAYYASDGDQLDLTYKQAWLGLNEYQSLVKMWGEPARTIFCLREPAGYIASAIKKFDWVSVEVLQRHYINSLDIYPQIGGDVFEYTSELSASDYIAFLKPLDLEGKQLMPFEYRGEQSPEHVSEEMWDAYHRIRELTMD